MGFRFRRTMRLLPGLRLNLGKKSASFSLGVKGLRATLGTRGKRGTIGIPGSGLSYTTTGKGSRRNPAASEQVAEKPPSSGLARAIVAVIMLAGLLWLMARPTPPPATPQARPASVSMPIQVPAQAKQPEASPRSVPAPSPARPAAPAPDPWAKARTPSQ